MDTHVETFDLEALKAISIVQEWLLKSCNDSRNDIKAEVKLKKRKITINLSPRESIYGNNLVEQIKKEILQLRANRKGMLNATR